MKEKFILFLFVLVAGTAVAQVPVINGIEPTTIYPGGKVVITGSGFLPDTPSQLIVWFDNVRGSVVAYSDFSIEVIVPNSARHGNIEVENLKSHLSAKSEAKFSPTYSGESLTAANAATKFSLLPTSVTTHTSEILDVCTCDFNFDGLADLAGSVPDNLGNVVKLAQNTSAAPGAITFKASNLTMNFPTTNLACGDLNGDGKPDLVGTRGGANSNEILIKTNTTPTAGADIAFGGALLQIAVDVGDRAYRIVIHDVDKDGKPDLVVTNANNSPLNPPVNNIYIFRNTTNVSGNISFASPLKIPVSGAVSTYGLEVQDLNNDRKPEIIVNQFNSTDIFILKNTSAVGQVSFDPAVRIPVASSLFNHLVTADFNKDGKYDIVVTNGSNSNLAHVLINTSTTSFSFTTLGPFTTGDGAWGVDAADLDGDGDVDAVIGNQDFNLSTVDTQITLLINDGNFANVGFTPVILNKGKKSRNVEIADFDKDGKLDIAFTSSQGGNSIEVLRNINCFVPKILNETPVTICNGQTIKLEAIPNAGATFQWKKDGADLAGQTGTTLDITTVGNYTLVANSETGACVKETAGLNVTANTSSVTTNPVITGATAGVITVCPNTTLQLATSSAEPTYSWTGPNGFTSSLQNPSIANISNAQAGIYTLQLINGVCKSNEATVRVDIASLESFTVVSTIPSNILCGGGSLTLATASQSGNQYQWIKDDVDLASQTAASLLVNAEGNYKVRVTNALSCSVVTDAVQVKVFEVPSAIFSLPATGCVGQVITFTNQSTGDSRGQLVYAWNFGNTQTSTENSPTQIYTAAQSFSVSLTVSYSGLSTCSDVETKPIVISTPAAIEITSSADGFCPGEPVTLTLPSGFTDIVWSTNQTTPSIEVATAGTISVTALDANKCSSEASTVVAAKPVPTLTITTDPSPPTVASGLPVKLQVAGADSYAWLPIENLDDPTIAGPTATPIVTTTYTVTGTLTDGCSAEASITVEVAGELKITNVFSPNGDGINDLWVIPGINTYAECTLSLFDTAGRKILEKRGYQNDWDGTYNGKPVPKGTYYYVIGGCPDKTPINGHVLVVY